MPRKTTDAEEIMRRRFVTGDPEMEALLEQERVNALLAEALYALRTEAGLTQRELARLVGTQPSVISRLEDADYRGHSLSMLVRIATALERRVEVRFVPTASGTRKQVVRRAKPRSRDLQRA